MALKLAHLLSCIFLLFLLLPLLSNAILSKKGENPSPFEFLKDLRGSQKGDKVKGVHELKKYVEKFGYLRYHQSKNLASTYDDVFDEILESAVKNYQLNYHLKPTGILDSSTMSKMMIPRCGVPDIINHTTDHHGRSYLNVGSRYVLPPGHPRWPASKVHFTVGFQAPTNAVGPVMHAFHKWANVTKFTFSKDNDFTSADLKISFLKRDHGDNAPFDGPGGILAHAGLPPDGKLHFDADEPWADGAVPGKMDIETVGLHEIGHLLGLGHSTFQNAIMFPYISGGTTKGLGSDDIQGIRTLYNL